MSYLLLVAATLVGPHENPSPDVWRDEYRVLLEATAESSRQRPEAVVPRLVRFYEQVETIDVLPKFERARMRRGLQRRLVRQLETLVLEQRRSRRHSRPGGGAIGAQQLIQVIVTTIAPDTWRQNGGNGSVMYYSINPALVVRQSGEVHEQVAQLLRGLEQ